MKKALITGITGQDGSYLAELLLEKGYEVHGIVRRFSPSGQSRIQHLFQDPHGPNVRLFLHEGDLTDASGLARILEAVLPDEVYHLGAQSHVRVSFDLPLYTLDSVGASTLRLLDAIRNLSDRKRIAFYQASSSEMFGKSSETPQNELTPFHPRSPYACAKLYAYWQTINYREAYGLHASNGILFNHESPRRGETFVTRKITRGLAMILKKQTQKLFMGNLEARRDWGFAKDYVEAMWAMVQQPEADDYVIATGESHSVRDFLTEAFALVGLQWESYVEQDPRYLRPIEVDGLVGDNTKARERLNWSPKTSFKELVRIMVAADLAAEGLSL